MNTSKIWTHKVTYLPFSRYHILPMIVYQHLNCHQINDLICGQSLTDWLIWHISQCGNHSYFESRLSFLYDAQVDLIFFQYICHKNDKLNIYNILNNIYLLKLSIFSPSNNYSKIPYSGRSLLFCTMIVHRIQNFSRWRG